MRGQANWWTRKLQALIPSQKYHEKTRSFWTHFVGTLKNNHSLQQLSKETIKKRLCSTWQEHIVVWCDLGLGWQQPRSQIPSRSQREQGKPYLQISVSICSVLAGGYLKDWLASPISHNSERTWEKWGILWQTRCLGLKMHYPHHWLSGDSVKYFFFHSMYQF